MKKMRLIHNNKSKENNSAGSDSIKIGMRKAAAGILAAMLAFVGVFGLMKVPAVSAEETTDTAAEAEDGTDTAVAAGTASIYLGDVTVYSVKKDETIVTVPIYAEGGIDMQCYDITVTYDRYLTVQTDDEDVITGITAFEDGYQDVNTDTTGTIHIAGVTLEDGADAADGQVGQLTFLVTRSVTKDGVTSELELTVTELGFGTEASEIEQSGAVVTMNKSDEPEEEETPAPVETTTYYYGDVNLSGDIEVSDALAILQHYVNLSELTGTALTLADVNHDDTVGVSDALVVLQVYVGLADKETVELAVE